MGRVSPPRKQVLFLLTKFRPPRRRRTRLLPNGLCIWYQSHARNSCRQQSLRPFGAGLGHGSRREDAPLAQKTALAGGVPGAANLVGKNEGVWRDEGETEEEHYHVRSFGGAMIVFLKFLHCAEFWILGKVDTGMYEGMRRYPECKCIDMLS
jgi:hypothetical protein